MKGRKYVCGRMKELPVHFLNEILRRNALEKENEEPLLFTLFAATSQAPSLLLPLE